MAGIKGIGILVEIIGDATSIFRAADSTVSATTKINTALEGTGKVSTDVSELQVKAIRRVIDAQTAAVVSQKAYLDAQVAAGGDVEAATLAHEAAQAKLNRTLGVSSASTARFGAATRSGEKDVGKFTRGVLAGSGAAAGMGRSLAFASGGFIAFAAGADLVAKSITSAEDLEKAQRSLGVAIQHTGGNVQKLEPIYTATAKAAAQFGISEADATTGLARATALTGGAAKAQRAYQEALVISKATGKDFNAVLTATAKGQEGITTSLRRYGILVSKTDSGTDQFTKVMSRFGGQATANTTATQKLSAAFTNAEATIGTDLLPTFNRLVSSFTDWLTKMQASGKLQKDVNDVVSTAGHVFHGLAGAIKTVDEVTGSFKKTVEALLALGLAVEITKLVGALKGLAAAWGLVGDKAVLAGTEQKAALTAGGLGGAEGAAGASAAARTAGSGVGALAIPATLLITDTKVTGNAKSELHDFIHGNVGDGVVSGLKSGFEAAKRLGIISKNNIETPFTGLIPIGAIKSLFGGGGPSAPTIGPIGDVGAERRRAAAEDAFFKRRQAQATPQAGPVTFKTFTDTISNQLAQARAALTRSTADDVAAAKAEVAFIKKEIAAGHLKGQSLLQGLQAEASAVSTIQSAEAAAAQKRAAAAQALQAKIQAQIENSINPLSLQVELAREQASGKSTLRTLEKQRAAARKALRTENLTQQQQIEAYNEITSLNQQIADALKTQKKKIKDRANAFRELDLSKETAGLGLTRAQRKALEARLSQIGPGRTVPDTGTGAFGEVIGVSGRPIHIHTRVDIDGKKVAENTTRHQQKHRRRNSSQRRGPSAGITG